MPLFHAGLKTGRSPLVSLPRETSQSLNFAPPRPFVSLGFFTPGNCWGRGWAMISARTFVMIRFHSKHFYETKDFHPRRLHMGNCTETPSCSRRSHKEKDHFGDLLKKPGLHKRKREKIRQKGNNHDMLHDMHTRRNGNEAFPCCCPW